MDLAMSWKRSRIRRKAWECRWTLQRWRRALAYALGTLDQNSARQVIYDCEPAARFYQYAGLSVDAVLEEAQNRYEPHPRLEQFVIGGIEYVARKCEISEEEHYGKVDWAIDVALDDAARAGVILIGRDAANDDAGDEE